MAINYGDLKKASDKILEGYYKAWVKSLDADLKSKIDGRENITTPTAKHSWVNNFFEEMAQKDNPYSGKKTFTNPSQEEVDKKLRECSRSLESLIYGDGSKFPDPCGTTAWYGEDEDDITSCDDDCGADERDYPGPEREQHFCEHEYVNVSFTGIKLVCKFCDKEKP